MPAEAGSFLAASRNGFSLRTTPSATSVAAMSVAVSPVCTWTSTLPEPVPVQSVWPPNIDSTFRPPKKMPVPSAITMTSTMNQNVRLPPPPPRRRRRRRWCCCSWRRRSARVSPARSVLSNIDRSLIPSRTTPPGCVQPRLQYENGGGLVNDLPPLPSPHPPGGELPFGRDRGQPLVGQPD